MHVIVGVIYLYGPSTPKYPVYFFLSCSIKMNTHNYKSLHSLSINYIIMLAQADYKTTVIMIANKYYTPGFSGERISVQLRPCYHVFFCKITCMF